MAIILYDLCARDQARRFSPHCWKARMALAHKELEFETRATPFTEIKNIGGGFSPTVPVIDDNGKMVRNSFDIALYLEDTYPDRPSLFEGEGGRAMARFIESFALTAIHPPLLTLIIKDIQERLDDADQIYFRESRENRFGKSLEDMQAGREDRLEGFRAALAPLRHMLDKQPFIGGRGAALRRLPALRPAAMGAGHQHLQDSRRGRSGVGLVRALPRPAWRHRPGHAGRRLITVLAGARRNGSCGSVLRLSGAEADDDIRNAPEAPRFNDQLSGRMTEDGAIAPRHFGEVAKRACVTACGQRPFNPYSARLSARKEKVSCQPL